MKTRNSLISAGPVGSALVLAGAALVGLALTVPACGGSKKPAETEGALEGDAPKNEGANANGASATDDAGSKSAASTSSDPEERAKAGQPNPCTAFEMDLTDVLSRAACEVPNPKADEKAKELKGILEVKAIPSTTKIAPGGKVDITVLVTNKGKGVLPLRFLVNPLPRFEVEAYDAKGNRIDVPPGDHPTWPKNHTDQVAEEKTAEIKLPENGSGRVLLSWEASKMKWAPEKAKGAAMGSSYPKAPGAPLPKGKYKVRVLLPLVGVFEGSDREVSGPKVDIEVGK